MTTSTDSWLHMLQIHKPRQSITYKMAIKWFPLKTEVHPHTCKQFFRIVLAADLTYDLVKITCNYFIRDEIIGWCRRAYLPSTCRPDKHPGGKGYRWTPSQSHTPDHQVRPCIWVHTDWDLESKDKDQGKEMIKSCYLSAHLFICTAEIQFATDGM